MSEFLFETERIGFAKWEQDDIELASSIWGNPLVMQFLSSRGYYTEDEIRQRLDQEINYFKENKIQYWKLYEKISFSFIGCCGLKPCDARDNSLELGFQFLPNFWGVGYAMEASSFCISYSLNIIKNDQIFSRHHPENTNSAKLLQKLGFKLVDNLFYEPTGLIHPFYKYENNDLL